MLKQLARLILTKWDITPDKRKVLEGEFTQEQLEAHNSNGYNCYYLPNGPSSYNPGKVIDGSMVDSFQYVFVDFDLKSNTFPSKEDFISNLASFPLEPTRIVDSGGGIHAYWRVLDLDAMSYLRLSRRLVRLLRTDEAVGQIYQLMRLPGTVNVKQEDNPRLCETLLETLNVYSSEQIDKALPPISQKDEAHCKQHYEKTYRLKSETKVDAIIPLKFSKLIASSKEAKDIWSGNTDDRSKGDYRLAHIMFAHDFTRQEAMSVLVNSSKALNRAPQHQVSYAENIVDKIWIFEKQAVGDILTLSRSVKDILSKGEESLKGTRFPCWRYLDATEHGFRLGQVIGLVAGSGVGKTAVALNMFMGFVQNNPDYDHFFVPLEQPAEEIADRWRLMCGDNTRLHDKVHVISNYADDGSFRHLSFDQIRDYILQFQKTTGRKAGCVVIDHIGALNKQGAKGENQDLMNICHTMKAFAIATNTLLVMQSQAPREKAGIGDLELDKSAAYGTVFFESYCDYLVAVWQPLKRCYSESGCPTVTAFKFCKIRHKNQPIDKLQEDVCYKLLFQPETGHLREMAQSEDESFKFWLSKATGLRKLDRKTDIVSYSSTDWTQKGGK